MSVTISLPTPLQKYADGQSEIVVDGKTVGEALKALTDVAPAVAVHLFTAEGKIKTYVNVYLGDEDTKYLQGNETPVVDGDKLVIVPSIAGG